MRNNSSSSAGLGTGNSRRWSGRSVMRAGVSNVQAFIFSSLNTNREEDATSTTCTRTATLARMYDQAIAEYRKISSFSDSTMGTAGLGYVYAISGKTYPGEGGAWEN